jgi:catechol 2,3-dioxygenase-like lactoylglutathione lyase family enzyme
MSIARVLAALSLIAPVAAGAATPPLTLATDRGWQEVVISTSDARRLETFFGSVAGWQVHWRGQADAALADHYAFATDERRAAPMREWLIGDSAAHPGLVRLIEFGSRAAISIRGATQPWDTGGILSIMTRSNDTVGVFRAAERAGWLAYNEPVDFDFGTIRLRNIVLRGPDGVNVSIYERMSPRLPDDADLRRLRRPFNSMQSVRRIDAARAFYVDTLGFEVVNAGDFVNPERAPNNFGMPANVVAANPIRFAIFAPRNDGPTAIETVEFVGAEGRDVSATAVPPNLGIVSVRFPVSNLAVIESRLSARDVRPAFAARDLELRPYGRVRMLGVRSPDGALLEFFQVRDKP